MWKNMWTVSNLLSFVRLLLAFPMAVLLLENNIWAAIMLGAIAVITDLLDGYLARKLNQISEFGKIIDPVADKVLVGTVAVCLVLTGVLPLWFVIAIVLRDILIVVGGIYAQGKVGKVIPSNYVGKVTVIIVTTVLTGAIARVPWFVDYGSFVALGALIISLAVYAIQMFKKIKDAEKGIKDDNSSIDENISA